jgi:hypothetical protein
VKADRSDGGRHACTPTRALPHLHTDIGGTAYAELSARRKEVCQRTVCGDGRRRSSQLIAEISQCDEGRRSRAQFSPGLELTRIDIPSTFD